MGKCNEPKMNDDGTPWLIPFGIPKEQYEETCIEDLDEQNPDEMLLCFLECEVNQGCDVFNECFVLCTGPDDNSGEYFVRR